MCARPREPREFVDFAVDNYALDLRRCVANNIRDDQFGGHFEDYLIGLLREAAGVAGSAATVRIALMRFLTLSRVSHLRIPTHY